jgi:hypothetical protein
MVDDMLTRRVEQQLLEVRRLMLQHEEAGAAICRAAARLSSCELQHLQVGGRAVGHRGASHAPGLGCASGPSARCPPRAKQTVSVSVAFDGWVERSMLRATNWSTPQARWAAQQEGSSWRPGRLCLC